MKLSLYSLLCHWSILYRVHLSLCPVFLTNLEGKVGKVGKVGRVGKVCKVKNHLQKTPRLKAQTF